MGLLFVCVDIYKQNSWTGESGGPFLLRYSSNIWAQETQTTRGNPAHLGGPSNGSVGVIVIGVGRRAIYSSKSSVLIC
jgi:hypothetical protein